MRYHLTTRLAAWGCLGFLILLLTSCASPQTHYLRGAVHHARQSVVTQHLGPPTEVWDLTDDETLLSYRTDQSIWAYWYSGYGNGNTVGLKVEGPGLTLLPGASCTEYVLRFDREQIFRAWIRQPCRGFEPGDGSTP